jgi:glycosyltransferase involved in cell wall biosynthesis
VKEEINNNNLLLSVCLLTYNHAPYIGQAIEGVLMQQTDFPFEFLILDDYSTDGTREVLLDYKKKYPDRITLLLNEKNLGAYQSWINLLNTPTSKYVAYFEGDDYWISPEKLQKQVDFLESHPDHTFVGHHVRALNQETGEMFDYGTHNNNPIRLKDTVFGPPVHTCSFMARNGMGFPTELKDLPAGDDAIVCHWASKGLGHSIPEFMGVYRMSNAGTWSILSNDEKDFRTLLIHLWIFKRFKPLFIVQATQIGQEVLNMIKRKPANLKRLKFKDWLQLILPILIFSVMLIKRKTKKWLKK